MTKVLNLCDICGRDTIDIKIKYEAKKKHMLLFPYVTWEAIDLCEDCLKKIINSVGQKEFVQYDADSAIGNYHCSLCRAIVDIQDKYCHECGARLEDI